MINVIHMIIQMKVDIINILMILLTIYTENAFINELMNNNLKLFPCHSPIVRKIVIVRPIIISGIKISLIMLVYFLGILISLSKSILTKYRRYIQIIQMIDFLKKWNNMDILVSALWLMDHLDVILQETFVLDNNIWIYSIMLPKKSTINNTHSLFKQVVYKIIIMLAIQMKKYMIQPAKHGATYQDSKLNPQVLIIHMETIFIEVLYSFVSKTIHANKRAFFVKKHGE